MGRVARTVENRADKKSGESSLLIEVHITWDIWSIGTGHSSERWDAGVDRRWERSNHCANLTLPREAMDLDTQRSGLRNKSCHHPTIMGAQGLKAARRCV